MAGRRGMLSNNWELKELNLTLHWSIMTKRACHRSGAVILLHKKCYLIFYKLCPVSVLYWQTSLVSVLLQLPSKSSQWREDVDVHQEVIKTKKISITSTTIHTLYQMWTLSYMWSTFKWNEWEDYRYETDQYCAQCQSHNDSDVFVWFSFSPKTPNHYLSNKL